jgi:hypothetical protein
MKLPFYEVLLPIFDNSGKPYPDQRREAFEEACLALIGAWTAAPTVIGKWRDEKTGTVYKDTCTPYRLMCLPAQFNKLLSMAHGLYPDQLSLFAAEIGKGWISYPSGAG